MIRRQRPFDIDMKHIAAGALGAALMLCASPALAQDETGGTAAAVQTETPSSPVSSPLAAPATPESETPWFEAFTLSMNESTPPSLSSTETFDLPLNGGRWGLSVGIDDHSDSVYQREDLSAGAFVNLGERFRLGGQVRFAAPESAYFGRTEPEPRQPEIKFESALRF